MGILVIIVSIVYLVIFGLSSLCIGAALLNRLGFTKDIIISARGRVGIALGLGMGIWGLIYLPISAAGDFWTYFGRAIYIALMLFAIAKWHRHFEDVIEAYKHWRKRRSESGGGLSLHYIFSILLALLMLLAFLNACGPVSSWDELVDHLPRAKHLVDNGAFIDDPSTPFAGYPALCELLFAPLTALTDEFPAVTVFTFAIALFLMLAGFARTFLPPGWANPTVIILFSMPLMSDLMHTALVDVPLACFCFGVFYLIAIGLTYDGENRRLQLASIFAAGMFLGFAMSVKYNGLLVAAGWLVVLPLTLLFKRVGLSRVIGWTLTFFITAIVVCGGWYARNWMLYNNPAYPFFSEMFTGTASALSMEAFMRPERANSLADILLYPVRLTFDFDLIRHWYRAISPAFLCFIPLGLILKRRDKFGPIFNLALWLGLVHLCLAYVLSPGHTRYLLPLWAIWAPLAAFGMARVSAGSRLLKGVIIPLTLIIPLLLMLAIQAKHFSGLVPYFVGQEKKFQYVSKDLPSVELMKRVGQFVPEDGKILSIEPRIYYLNRDTVIGTPGIEAPDAPNWDEESTSAIAVDLQFKGYTHLLIDFSSRQLKHAMGMDFFIANTPQGAEGRYFTADGSIELMEKKYGIAKYFTREDLYTLSAIGGFDIYLDPEGRDWHWVQRATIEERSQFTPNLKFIRHFWLMENSILHEVDRDGAAVLYEIKYRYMNELRSQQKRYKGGRLKDMVRNPELTPELQYPIESELTLHKKQDGEGMI